MSTVHWHLPLDAARDPASVGGKAAALGTLVRAGCPTPDGIVLTTDLMHEFFLRIGCPRDTLGRALRHESHALEHVRTCIATEPWPRALAAFLESIYTQLPPLVCVRSSAVAEDGREDSFAGIYHSAINVRTFGEFLGAVRRCWHSAFNTTAVQYARHTNRPLTPMALLVQSLADPLCAGTAVVEGERLTVYAVHGHGIGVATGTVAGDLFVWETPHASPTVTPAHKTTGYLANPSTHPAWPGTHFERTTASGDTLTFEVLEPDRRHALLHCALHFDGGHGTRPVVDEATRSDLARNLYDITDRLGPDAREIEWCLTTHPPGMSILQARPLTKHTARPGADTREAGDDTIVCVGYPISPGVGEGPAVHVRSREDVERIECGDVIVADRLADVHMAHLADAAAVVVAGTSPLSHSAVVAREWQIPCVGGIARNTLVEGRHYRVDGHSGSISAAAPCRTATARARPSPAVPEVAFHPIALPVRAWITVVASELYARDLASRWARHRWHTVLAAAWPGQPIDLHGVATAFHLAADTPLAEAMQETIRALACELVHRARSSRLRAHGTDRRCIEAISPATTELLANRWECPLPNGAHGKRIVQ